MKKGMARGRGNAKKRVADMSLPPEQRGRQRRGKGRGTTPTSPSLFTRGDAPGCWGGGTANLNSRSFQREMKSPAFRRGRMSTDE